MENLPFITIVLPVFNEAETISTTLRQLLQQDYPADLFEVIVCDGGSADDTRCIVDMMAAVDGRVHLRNNPGRRSSSGRNVGFRCGRGDVFVVVDGHCFIPSECWLHNVADAFMQSGADCLGRPQPLDPPGISSFQQAVALARASRIGHGDSSLIYCDFEGYASPVSNGAAYRRNVFERIGFVDESFDACEDVEFNYRVEQAGLRAYTSPKLAVKYYPRESLSGLFQQMVRYGIGRFRLLAKHPATLSNSILVPPLFVVWFVLAMLFLLVFMFSSHLPPVWLSAIIIGPYCIYSVLILGESIRIARREGWKYLKWIPSIFITIHFGLGLGFLSEAARYAVQCVLRRPFEATAS